MSRALLKLLIVCATAFAVVAPSANAAVGPGVDFVNDDTPLEILDSSNLMQLEYTNLVSVDLQHCRVDDAAYGSCFDAMSYQPVMRNGAHTFSVRTLDTDGDIHVEVLNFTINDTVDPAITASVVDGSPIADRPRFEITLDDQYATVYASIGGRGPERFIARGSTFTWAPESIPTGSYDVVFKVYDPAMNLDTATVSVVNNDSVAPSISITNPTAGADLANGNLEATFTTDDPDARFTCAVDGGPQEYCNPNWAFVIEGIAEGPHELTVYALDSSGNSSATSHQFTVQSSSIAGLTVLQPASGSTYTAEPKLDIDSSVSLVAGSLRCSISGQPFKSCNEGDRIAGVKHNGPWTLTVRALSVGGERVQAVSTFTVDDTSAPIVTLDPGPTEVIDVDQFTIPGTIQNSFADGSPSTSTVIRCAVDSNPFEDCTTAIFGPTAGVSATLTHGVHLLQVRATDWVGNTANGQTFVDITDDDPPTVQIVSPASSTTVSGGGLTVEYKTTGGESSTDFSMCRIDSLPSVRCAGGNLDGIQSWTPVGLTPGAHTITVSHSDLAGNTGSASISITVADSTSPVLEFRSPDSLAVMTDRISLAFTSNEKISRVRCAIDDMDLLAEDTDQCDMDDATRRTGFFRPTTLASGLHTLIVQIYDIHGNSSVAGLTITAADVTAPDIRFDHTIYRAGTDGRDTPAALSYSSTDLAAKFTCRYDAGPAYPCGTGRASTDLPAATNGVHELEVTATDPSGNSASRVLEYVVKDATAPDLDVSGVTEGMAVGASVTVDVSGSYDASLTCAIDGGLYGPCGLDYVFNFTASGNHTLRFRAIDPAGNQTNRAIVVSATVPGDPPTDPPTNPPTTPPVDSPVQGTASFTKSKVTIKKKKATLAYAMKITLPAGVSAASACTGSVEIALTKKQSRKTISIAKQKATLKPGSGTCTIAGTLRFKTALITKSKWTLSATFAGNAKLAPLYKAKAGKTGKTSNAK